MGGMKDEAKRITIPPLFPRVHVNKTGRGDLSQSFDGKTMSPCKRFLIPSSRDISDSPSDNVFLSLPPPVLNKNSIDQFEKNQFSLSRNISPPSKLVEKTNKTGTNYPSPTVSSVTSNKPNVIKQNEYYFKNLTNLDSLQDPPVRRSEIDPHTNTDLSLLFGTSNSNKAGGEAAAGSMDEILLSDCLECPSHNKSLNLMNTPKKLKTVPEQDVSDSTAVDSLSGLSAASKDIIRVIGDKKFWKMRRYIINQQKIFKGQVFELHRLIMVQKMFAKSPSLVLESKLSVGKHGTIKSSHLLEIAVPKVKKSNTKPSNEEYRELLKPKLPTKELVTPIWQQQLLPHPGSQWLVPVMSPSEGLIYKPYAEPCHLPSSASMIPVYGKAPLEPAFMFPDTPQFSHIYFPPTNMKTTIDQSNQFGQSQRWSNTPRQMTQAISISLKKSQESYESELHGSTASSPPEKHKLLEVLPLFPTEPTHQTDEYKQKQQQPLIRAIKAIPYNPISATESAARIFRSIQEERKDSDDMIC